MNCMCLHADKERHLGKTGAEGGSGPPNYRLYHSTGRALFPAGRRERHQGLLLCTCASGMKMAGFILPRGSLIKRVVQVCWAIKPEKQDVPYLLVLEKASTQEEYIRGSLPHNPYFSTQVGPLMRNVKNFICEQLDLAGESFDNDRESALRKNCVCSFPAYV